MLSRDCVKIATNIYSDFLYRPILCANINLDDYVGIKDNISRITSLDETEFDDWAHSPFIMTDVVTHWKAFHTWNLDILCQRYGKDVFRAEAVDWPLQLYLQYMKNNSDDSPLYLFDKNVIRKTDLREEYDVPKPFQEDFFNVLRDQRPDFAWLIIGPRRSGSTFHIDPNHTAAWNAAIRGRKLWLLFPPGVLPPGVYVSENYAEVTSPLSIADWLLNYYQETKNIKGMVQCICKEGEVLYVPAGWFHMVVNITDTIAITQNFVPRVNLTKVLRFLKDRFEQVSGFPSTVQDPFRLFVDCLKNDSPLALESAMESIQESSKRKWECIAGGSNFNFGFNDHC